MTDQKYAYLLTVWDKKPEDPFRFQSESYWVAHVKNAPNIPRIGEALESSCGPDDYRDIEFLMLFIILVQFLLLE